MNFVLKNLRYIILFLMILVFAGCSQKKHSETVIIENGVVTINVLKARENVSDFPLSTLIKDFEFIKLEASADSYFTMFTSLDVTEHFILVASEVQDKVLLFSRSGKFLKVIGQTGRGPGEYLHPHYVALDPTEKFVIVMDEMSRVLYKYTIEDVCVKQVNLLKQFPTRPNYQPVFIDNKHFAISFNRPRVQTDDHYNVAVFDLELNLVERMLHKPNNDSLCLDNISAQRVLLGFGKSYYWESFIDTLYSLKSGNAPKPEFYFNLEGTGQPLGFLNGKELHRDPVSSKRITGIADFPEYLFFILYQDESLVPMVYSKNRHEVFTWDAGNTCVPIDIREDYAPRWQNDLYGLPVVMIKSSFPKQNLVTSVIGLGDFENLDLACLRNMKVSLPEKRDQLATMIEGYTGEENPVLVLMYLK